MANKRDTNNDDGQLNIPSFLANPTMQSRAEVRPDSQDEEPKSPPKAKARKKRPSTKTRSAAKGAPRRATTAKSTRTPKPAKTSEEPEQLQLVESLESSIESPVSQAKAEESTQAAPPEVEEVPMKKLERDAVYEAAPFEAEDEVNDSVLPTPIEDDADASVLTTDDSPTSTEDEVDAVMQTIREAAGVSTPKAATAEAPKDILASATADFMSAHKEEAAAQLYDTPAKSEATTETVSENVSDAAPDQATTTDEAPTEEPQPTEASNLEPSSSPAAEAAPTKKPEPPTPTPTIEEALATLEKVERHLYAHRYAADEIQAFGETLDPAKASADRAEALAVLVEEDHELLSKPEVGAMIERLGACASELDPMVAAQVRVLTRDRKRLVSVSASDQARLVRLQSEAYDAWLLAKKNNDWRSFAPYLDKLVILQRKIAKAMNPDADPYDTLLDEYEPGTNRAFYNSFFARIKRSIIPLLSSISMSGRTLSRDCVAGTFDPLRQWELARDIAKLEGIDEDAHFLTTTEHPFSSALTSNYAITATHIYADDLMSNVYTILHEIGHSMYEQGVNPEYNRISLKGGTSMGMHEAQSRFFENYVGRDRAFIGVLLALLKKHFPGQLGRVTPNQLYRAVNRVAPTLIRTEADELTYPLHIIVRYEIEQLLIDGKASAREVPKLWADRYHKYIGASVTSDTEGALQDVHWAWGSFGYFPSYALGNAYAAQLRAKMIEEGLDWKGTLSAGDLSPIRTWLHDRVWQYGRLKDPADIMKDACGEPFNPRHYANYLTEKYTALYNLR